MIRSDNVAAECLTWRPAGVVPASISQAESLHGARGPRANLQSDAAGARTTEEELERRTKEAFEAGVTQGEAAGRQRAEAELQARIQTLGRTTSEIAGLRPKIRRETERELVELALAIARRILHRELTVDPEALSALVKAAMQKIDLRETHRLRTHPEHTAAVSRCLAQIGAPAQIEVVGDARLERGAAVFETSRGTLDASVETQLAEIQHGFADLMGAE
ncbi:MAG TPA: FliH/SctL family protein [Bryobacteraceae bacterium]|nr:FliH/SctL family protein [Bryobacteraceae bacterium]